MIINDSPLWRTATTSSTLYTDPSWIYPLGNSKSWYVLLGAPIGIGVASMQTTLSLGLKVFMVLVFGEGYSLVVFISIM